MRLLALDQSSTNCGWCLVVDGVIKEYGVVVTSEKHTLEERTISMCRDLKALIAEKKPDFLCVEDMYGAPGRFTALRALAIVRGAIILLWHQISGTFPVAIKCSQARAHIGIPGNAKKPEVMTAVAKKFGVSTANEHVADAIVIGVVGYDMLKGGETPKESVANPARIKVVGKKVIRGATQKGGGSSGKRKRRV